MKTLGWAILLILVSSQVEARSRSGMSPGRRALDEALVAPPADQEVCFSPDEPCDIKLHKFVASAKESIDLAIYDINLDSLVHELLVQSRKIPVRILVDRKQARGSHSLVPLLVKSGVQIRYGHQRGIMHNKFTLVDGKRLETGSFNHTHHAAFANSENQIYLSAPAIVSRYRKRFEKLWAEGEPVR
jgi:phosphatidylserine/phosphatidylglycerophosphate/cardiolipin synthase-like enzyme